MIILIQLKGAICRWLLAPGQLAVLCPAERGQKHPGENRNGDDDQEFDGEGLRERALGTRSTEVWMIWRFSYWGISLMSDAQTENYSLVGVCSACHAKSSASSSLAGAWPSEKPFRARQGDAHMSINEGGLRLGCGGRHQTIPADYYCRRDAERIAAHRRRHLAPSYRP